MTSFTYEPCIGMTSVRPAKGDDVPWLLSELRDFAHFFGTKISLFPKDEGHARLVLATLIAEHCFFIAERDYTRVGFIAGSLATHPLNPDIRLLSEVFWWVTPSERNGRAGILLLHEFLKYGKAHADWIHMTLEAKSPVNPKTLERRGFHLHESAYLLEVVS